MEAKILSILSEIRPEFDFTGSSDFVEDGMLDSFDIAALVAELDKVYAISIDGVDIVQLDTEWVSRFNAILDVIRRGVFLAAVLFALGILVIIGNTIRLDIENRRGEIEVTKLVGGSDAFVRRPFLYNGVWYGLAGGLIAGLIVAIVVLMQPFEPALRYQNDLGKADGRRVVDAEDAHQGSCLLAVDGDRRLDPLLVAGDIRENVIAVLHETLNAIKTTVTEKTEYFSR